MKPSQNTRILKLLSDGEWHGHHSLYAIGCVAHSRISELRKHDYNIEKRQFTVYGKQVWEYRLVGEVEEARQTGAGVAQWAERFRTAGEVAGSKPVPGPQSDSRSTLASSTSSTDQPGQSYSLDALADVSVIVPAEHLHADTLELV